MKPLLDLSTLVTEGFVSEIRGDAAISFSGIKHDSRRVEPGDLFVALTGEHIDGLGFVSDAYERGAVAVVTERPLDPQSRLVIDEPYI